VTALELDRVYTQLCNTLTEIGSAHAEHYLPRFAMLALSRELSFECAQRLINDAARDLRVPAGDADAAGSGVA
jgi:hypothetical protein